MPADIEVTIGAFQLVPDDPADAARWNESRKRRRMLEGLWETDVRERIKEYFSRIRELTLGKPNLGLNLFNSVVSQQSILYDQPFTVVAPEGTSDEQKAEFSTVLDDAHLAQLLQRNCRNVTGLREGLMKLVPTDSGLRYNVVPSDVVVVEHVPGDPSTLTKVSEGIVLSDGRTAWEVWDIKDPTKPTRKILTSDGTDISADVLKEPGVYLEIGPKTGEPFLPYVLYHAEWSDKVWNAYDLSELPNASLDLAVLWTMFGDGVRNAAWPQRYAINLRLDGATVTKGPDARAGYIDTAPTSLIVFKVIDPNSPASAGQYAPGCDPKTLAESILIYMGVVLNNLGISPADLQAQPNAQSGYAIQLKRSAQRREATKVIPNFRDGDTELLDKTAMMENIYSGTSYPEEGWGVAYNLPALGQAEMMEALETRQKELELGLASKVDVFVSLNPDWAIRERSEVVAHLREIARENAEF